MRILRVFRLTEEAEEKGVDWSNFEKSDIETVAEIEVDDPEGTADADGIMIDNGYGDFDIYGCEWL